MIPQKCFLLEALNSCHSAEMKWLFVFHECYLGSHFDDKFLNLPPVLSYTYSVDADADYDFSKGTSSVLCSLTNLDK